MGRFDVRVVALMGRLSLSLVLLSMGCDGSERGDTRAASFSDAGTSEDGALQKTGSHAPSPEPPHCIDSANVLFIVGEENLRRGDLAARHRFEALGFTVTQRTPQTVQDADTDGQHLIAISSTIFSPDLSPRFRSLPVPILTWENNLYEALAMATTADREEQKDAVRVVDGGHPMGAGVSGLVQTSTQRDSYGFAHVAKDASVIATSDTTPSRASIFTYETGATMLDGMRAPARRSGFFFTDNGPDQLTDVGAALFDATILFTAGLEFKTAERRAMYLTGDHPLETGDAQAVARLEQLGFTVDVVRDVALDSSPANLALYAVVIVSESVFSSNIGRSLTDAQVPVVSGEAFLLDDLGMATRVGTVSRQTRIRVTDSTRGFMGGLLDIPVVTTTPSPMLYATPAVGAEVGATLPDNQARATVFGFEVGAALTSGPAPARRGAYFVHRPSDLNATGWRVFDTMVNWAAGGPIECWPDDTCRTTYYPDRDRDSWGDDAAAVVSCKAPPDYIDRGGDCDDQMDETFPGAVEVCDGIDNDCDGEIDTDASSYGTFYRDRDGDTFGDEQVTVDACEAPSGYVGRGGDCDDLNDDKNPAALEVCDAMDNDCDGLTDEGCP